MIGGQFLLLKEKRFWPLFVTQFLGAFNDNLFKTGLSVLVAYGLWDIGGVRPEILVSLAAALFIIPFILFTPFAGELADKYDKARIMSFVKMVEIVLAVLAGLALIAKSIPILLFVLFMFGTHSAVFSPSKYSILPRHLAPGELIGGNALVNTGTYIAILLGNILGGLLGVSAAGLDVMVALLLVCALAGYACARQIPEALPLAPDLRLSINIPRQAWNALRHAWEQPRGVFTAMIGSSWFFFVGGLYLSQFPNYTGRVLMVDNLVLTLFMSIFSVGIALGGLFNNRLLRARVEATYVPLAALMIAAFSLDLYFATPAASAISMQTPAMFLSRLAGWRVVFDLLMIALAGGIYAVPLKAILQQRTAPEYASRVMAASSLMDALFILASAVIATLLFSAGFEIIHLFVLVAIISIFMSWYLRRLNVTPRRA